MVSVLDRLRPDTTTARTRLLMAGAVLGAVLALGISMAVASPSNGGTAGSTDGRGPEGGGLASPEAEFGIKYAYDAVVGHCLLWEKDDGSDMRQVKCSEPHLFEVTEIADITEGHPAGTELPSAEQFRELATKRCTKGAAVYINKKLDPQGKLTVSALRPNKTDWDRGNRDLRCGLWRVGPGGSLQATVGPAVENDQSDVWATGTCLGIVDKSAGDPVKCAEKHSYEMISIVDLSKEFDDYPSAEEQDEWLSETCAKAAKTYAKGRDLDKLKLIIHWDKRTEKSWKAGSHLVNCKVGALLDDKSGLAPVTGSVADAPKPSEKPSGSKPPKTSN